MSRRKSIPRLHIMILWKKNGDLVFSVTFGTPDTSVSSDNASHRVTETSDPSLTTERRKGETVREERDRKRGEVAVSILIRRQ